MIRATRVGLGSQEEHGTAVLSARLLPCQTSCPAPRAGGHPRLKLRCEEQAPGPMSRAPLCPGPGAQCVGRARRSSGPRQRPPPPGSREPCFHSLCSVAQHLQTERAPSTPYSTRSCPGASPSRPGPFLHPTGHTPSLLRGSVSLLGRPGQPAPACWVPASHSPALGASGPACRPHTHLLSLYSSVSSRGRPGGGCHPVA